MTIGPDIAARLVALPEGARPRYIGAPLQYVAGRWCTELVAAHRFHNYLDDDTAAALWTASMVTRLAKENGCVGVEYEKGWGIEDGRTYHRASTLLVALLLACEAVRDAKGVK